MPAQAQAAGFWNLDRGPSHYGRGGANIANPQDPVALYTNPAGLAGLRGLQLNVDGNMLFDGKTFTRAPQQFDRFDGTYTYEFETVRNTAEPFPPSPGIFAAYNFANLGLPGLTVALGGYGPPRSDTVYPATETGCDPAPANATSRCNAPQRYSMVESHNLQIHYALGVAYELPWLQMRLGVNFMLIDQIIDTRLTLNAGSLLGDQPEDPGWDVDVKAQAAAHGVPSAAFGFSMAPFSFLKVGIVYQLPYSVNAKGTAQLTVGDDMAQLATVQGDRIRVRLSMPSIFRAAIQYDDPAGLFDVELAFVWEGWSQNRQIIFAPKDISVNVLGNQMDIGRVYLNNNWEDTFSLRLGGEVNVFPDLWLLRAGAYYEKSPVPLNRVNAGSFDLDKFGFTLGSRVDFPLGFWLDVAAGLVLFQTAEVTDSQVLLNDPLTGEDLHAVGNGIYSNTAVYLMAGLGVQIDI